MTSNAPDTTPRGRHRQHRHTSRGGVGAGIKRAPTVAASRRLSARVIAGLVLLVLAALVATTPFILMVGEGGAHSAATSAHDTAANELTQRERAQELASARDYNRRLFASGQAIMGDVTDPFTSSANGDETYTEDHDKDYQSQLDEPSDGIMATIRYPKLGINLPVRHGTNAKVLADGAGHMYGTSLPVGGKNTHSVISAHTGMGDRVMFDKLSLRLGKKGDFFYITVLGRDMAYVVRDIRVVQPDDFQYLRIEQGRDLVTLLTCTPYGVNTQRLLVTGERTRMPHPAPPLRDAHWDPTVYWVIAGIVAVWLGLITFIVRYLRRRHGLIAGR